MSYPSKFKNKNPSVTNNELPFLSLSKSPNCVNKFQNCDSDLWQVTWVVYVAKIKPLKVKTLIYYSVPQQFEYNLRFVAIDYIKCFSAIYLTIKKAQLVWGTLNLENNQNNLHEFPNMKTSLQNICKYALVLIIFIHVNSHD